MWDYVINWLTLSSERFQNIYLWVWLMYLSVLVFIYLLYNFDNTNSAKDSYVAKNQGIKLLWRLYDS